MGDWSDKIIAFIKLNFDLNKKFFMNIATFVWGAFGVNLPEFLTAGEKKVKEVLSDVEDSAWEKMLKSFIANDMIDAKDYKSFYDLRKLTTPYDLLMYISVAFKLFFNFLGVQTEANMNLQSQKVNHLRRPNIPWYGDVINAAFIAPEKTKDVKEVMKRLGFTDDHIDLIFLSRYQLYPEETIKILFLREILSKDEMFMRMREHGYTDTRIKEIAQSWKVIPGPQDLFWMVGKEAFEPKIIKTIGLGDEFPVEQSKWLEMQGISREWQEKYWAAHWDQPSIQQGFEMLHRDVIKPEELDILFKAVEIPPFWRKKLTQIAYTPFTRVDVRRMHGTGDLEPEDVLQAYKDIGYDAEKALTMTKFTINYNKQNDKEITKGQVISSFKEDMINREDTKDLLMLLEYSDDQAEFIIINEEYKKDKKYTDQIIKNIGDKYVLNLIDRLEVTKRLNTLNLPDIRVKTLLETWEIDRYEDTKMPSKTDLDKFLRNKIIDKDTYRAQMKLLGYPILYVSWYEQLIAKNKAG